jgi:hypothetical protein
MDSSRNILYSKVQYDYGVNVTELPSKSTIEKNWDAVEIQMSDKIRSKKVIE